MHNLTCEQTGLMEFFDPAGYGMLSCPIFQRSARIDRDYFDKKRVPGSAETLAGPFAHPGTGALELQV